MLYACMLNLTIAFDSVDIRLAWQILLSGGVVVVVATHAVTISLTILCYLCMLMSSPVISADLLVVVSAWATKTKQKQQKKQKSQFWGVNPGLQALTTTSHSRKPL